MEGQDRQALETGYEVVHRPDAGPSDDAGLGVFKDLLTPSLERGITRFPFGLAASETLEPHRHDADLAAGVTAGELIFGFGPGLRERVVVGAGDYIVIRAGVAHAEGAGDAGPMHAVVACLGPFTTEPV